LATPEIPVCPPPAPAPKSAKLRSPSGAIDCHTHVFGPESKYPYSPARGYTPPDASLDSLLSLHEALGIGRVVLTQPSVYGTDNSALLDALGRLGSRGRGVAAVDKDVSNEELHHLNDAGVRGTRVNLADKGGNPFDSMDDVRRFSDRLGALGWHLELLIHADDFMDLYATFTDFPVDIVVGHLGYMKTGKGLDHPGFGELLELVREGRCWIKLTGTYRITEAETPPYPDVTAYAQALINANPDRMLWGTDWPHPHHYRGMPTDDYLLDQLLDWTDDGTIGKILVDNPESLYGF